MPLVSSGQVLSGQDETGEAWGVESGGLAVDDIFGGSSPSTSGSLEVYSGGVASGCTVNDTVTTQGSNGPDFVVDAGGSAVDTVLNAAAAYAFGVVYGEAISTTVESNFIEYVESGGLTVSTQVGAYGQEVALSGGVVSGAMVGGAGKLIVSGGGSAIDVTVNQLFGEVDVDSGGLLSQSVITTQGTAIISSGGLAEDVTIGVDSIIDVYGSASGVNLAGGWINILGGSVVTGITGAGTIGYGDGTFSGVMPVSPGIAYDVGRDAIFNLSAGAVASGVLVAGELIVSGTASNTNLDDGVLEVVAGGSLVGETGNGTIIYGSGVVLSGVTLDAQTFVLEIGSGGVADDSDLTARSTLIIDGGGVMSGGVISGAVVDYGLMSNVTIHGAAPAVVSATGVSMGGTFDGGDVAAGATLIVTGDYAAAVASGVTLQGTMVVDGTASNTILDYGTLVEEGAGVLVGATGTGTIDYQGIVISGATLASPSVVYEITSYDGAYGELDNSDVTAASTVIEGYQAKLVSCTVEGALIAEGSTLFTTIDGPAIAVLSGNGYFVSGDIASGSTMVVTQFASAYNTTVEGTLVVQGVASGIVLDGGTVEQIGTSAIVAGGSGSGTLIFGGGIALQSATLNAPAIVYEIAYGAQLLASDVTSVSTVVIAPGANAGGDTVEGELILDSGAQIGGAGLTLVGGEAILGGSVNSAGTVIGFSGSGGDLVIDDVGTFHAVISGFSTSGQKIDLGGYTYSAGETVTWTEAAGNTSGTLMVSGAGMTANLTLLGDYATSNFSLSDDGIGGTFVTDPVGGGGGLIAASTAHSIAATSPIMGGQVASFAQAMATFSEPLAAAHGGWIPPAANIGFGQAANVLSLGAAISGMG